MLCMRTILHLLYHLDDILGVLTAYRCHLDCLLRYSCRRVAVFDPVQICSWSKYGIVFRFLLITRHIIASLVVLALGLAAHTAT